MSEKLHLADTETEEEGKVLQESAPRFCSGSYATDQSIGRNQGSHTGHISFRTAKNYVIECSAEDAST